MASSSVPSIETAAWAGRAMDGGDVVGRQKAVDRGNNVVVLDSAEVERWREAAAGVVDNWVADMDAKGVDGALLVRDARQLLQDYSQ